MTTERDVELLLQDRVKGRIYMELASWRGQDKIFNCYELIDGFYNLLHTGTLRQLRQWATCLKPIAA